MEWRLWYCQPVESAPPAVCRFRRDLRAGDETRCWLFVLPLAIHPVAKDYHGDIQKVEGNHCERLRKG